MSYIILTFSSYFSFIKFNQYRKSWSTELIFPARFQVYYALGEDVNSADSCGNTLLHMLARKGDSSSAALTALLALRANGRRVVSTEARNKRGETPLHMAAQLRTQVQLLRSTWFRQVS